MSQDLTRLVARAMQDPELSGLLPVVEKEVLHYHILFAMEQGGFLDGLVFRGGTALRLCHGAPRFSEDLDFAGGVDFTGARLTALGRHLSGCLSKRYGLETIVQSPTGALLDARRSSLDPVIRRWRSTVATRPSHRHMPRQRINLEIGNIPSYAHECMTMKRNYDFLPDGYEDMILRVETKEEILADKLVAFPATLPRHTRWRDLWDLRWLGRQGTTVNADRVAARVRDYRVEDFAALLAAANRRIGELVDSDQFVVQMKRFLPGSVVDRTVQRQVWRAVAIDELKAMLGNLQRQLHPHATRRV